MSAADSLPSPSRPLAAPGTPSYLDHPGLIPDQSRSLVRVQPMSLSGLSPGGATGGPDHASDAALVTRMAMGDEAAATHLYDRTSAMLFGLALRITGERVDAEEVVLETYAQAWREAGRFDATKASVVAWLTMMTRSRALDCVRARQRRAKATEHAGREPDQPVAMSQGATAADAQLEQGERAVAVASALSALPTPQRQAIELAFFEGLTHPEVAARLHEPLGTVKTRIRLGMHKLRETLARWAPDAREDAT